MENKEIIVDGVNVKDCKRRIGKNNYCRYYKRLCSENNYNCIWKKYLRKEQECERLKEDEKSLLNVIDDLQKTKNEWQEKYNDLGQDFDQLKAENEELKKCYKNNSALLCFEETNTTKLVNKVMKLDKTLAEIKEITKQCFGKEFCTGCKYCEQCYVENGKISTYDVCKIILQKIRECEVENEKI